jgi:hypothetical protein
MITQSLEASREVESWAAAAILRARSVLAASPIYVLREVQVENVDDALLLSGRVDSFYHKQLAQEMVRTVSDGMPVINSLVVE